MPLSFVHVRYDAEKLKFFSFATSLNKERQANMEKALNDENVNIHLFFVTLSIALPV